MKLNSSIDETRSLLVGVVGEKCWKELGTKIINTATLLHGGIIREDTAYDLVTKPLSKWMKELSTEQRTILRQSIEIDRAVKGIIIDAIWAVQRRCREAR